MAIKFTAAAKHGTVQFVPGVALAFEDPDAEDYFIEAGWAEATSDEPVHTYDAATVSIEEGCADRTARYNAQQEALAVRSTKHTTSSKD